MPGAGSKHDSLCPQGNYYRRPWKCGHFLIGKQGHRSVEMTSEEKRSLRNKSWHTAHLTFLYMENKRHNEIIWFSESTDILPRSEMQVDGDFL